MKKTTQDIRSAFEAGKARSIRNTATDGKAVFLHGNKIVERRADGVYFSLAGWNTLTTRDRVNGITGAGVRSVNFTPCRGGKPIDYNAWHKV